jgi:uncharacterized protein
VRWMDTETMIPLYPDFVEIDLTMRPALHPRFHQLPDGISEFTFANLFLFRHDHQYRIARLDGDMYAIVGRDHEGGFFMLPFGLPADVILRELFSRFGVLKNLTTSQAETLEAKGYAVHEDRDNFDYLYKREDLANLSGRKLHKKKNLVNTFRRNNNWKGLPLLEDYRDQALDVLERWKRDHDDPGDYAAAYEALEKMWDLQLCGGIFRVDDMPVAFTLGEELAGGTSFVIHFEKAHTSEKYRGIYQAVNQSFASILPEKYQTINREQDMGDLGLRQAKESYAPLGFVKKFRAEA